MSSVRHVAIAVLLAAGCGTTRPVEAPPPYDDSGIVISVEPRVYMDWPFRFETIRGTAENRTGHDVDLHLYLNLVDSGGAVVGHAFAYKEGFRKGAKWRFEAHTARGAAGERPGPGPAQLFDLSLFARPPPYTKVERGFVCDPDAVLAFAEYVLAVAQCGAQLSGGLSFIRVVWDPEAEPSPAGSR